MKQTITLIRCDWCKSVNWQNVGTEWSGHAILACKTPGCGHEWVETSIENAQSKFFEWIESDDFKTIVQEIQMLKDKSEPK